MAKLLAGLSPHQQTLLLPNEDLMPSVQNRTELPEDYSLVQVLQEFSPSGDPKRDRETETETEGHIQPNLVAYGDCPGCAQASALSPSTRLWSLASRLRPCTPQQAEGLQPLHLLSPCSRSLEGFPGVPGMPCTRGDLSSAAESGSKGILAHPGGDIGLQQIHPPLTNLLSWPSLASLAL